MQNAIINSTHQTSVRRGARRMIGGVMAALVAFAAVPGVVSAADAPRRSQVKAPNPAPREEAKAVGACNSAKDCKALKAACEKSGYDYTPPNVGVKADTSPTGQRVVSVTLASSQVL